MRRPLVNHTKHARLGILGRVSVRPLTIGDGLTLAELSGDRGEVNVYLFNEVITITGWRWLALLCYSRKIFNILSEQIAECGAGGKPAGGAGAGAGDSFKNLQTEQATLGWVAFYLKMTPADLRAMTAHEVSVAVRWADYYHSLERAYSARVAGAKVKQPARPIVVGGGELMGEMTADNVFPKVGEVIN